jgi:hypothetical protein
MRNAKRQREEQRANARGERVGPRSEDANPRREVKVALGPLYEVAVARQKQLGYARLSEYMRRIIVDHFAAERVAVPQEQEAAGGAV